MNPLWNNHTNTIYSRERIESDYNSIKTEDKTERIYLNNADKQDGETGMSKLK